MIKRIHHLNCGTMCPFCQKMINGTGSWNDSAKLVCHCLLIETSNNLILVDTGFGSKDIQSPATRLGRLFTTFARPKLSVEETAIYQLEKLGYSKNDVTHILPTHLDLDHAGGLSDFPNAKVHIYLPEIQQILEPTSFMDKMRFRKVQFQHKPSWVIHQKTNKKWFNNQVIQPLADLPDIFLLPLLGHTKGHVGVAVHFNNKWLLHCGDAYYHRGQITKQPVPTGLKFFENRAKMDKQKHAESLSLLRSLHQNHSDEIELFCAHDPVEFERYSV